MQTVHVRVNDAATGKPTPVRIRFTDAQGNSYSPFGRLTKFATDMNVDVGGNVLLGGEPHAYIDGTCEINLPAGAINVTITKGPEYQPIQTQVTLAPGKLSLRFQVQRWIDLRTEGWYSGDTRCHFLTPHAALLEAAAEDVAVVNLLAWECLVAGEQRQYPAIPNILAFSGQSPALELPGHIVVVNTMNLHWSLGCLLLLNCHRVVYPLTCGGPDGHDNWRLADWCDQCHRKGGLVVGDNFFGNYPEYPHGELLADLLLGKVDALQMDGFENPEVDAKFEQASELKQWYWLLDCGFRVPLVGGSGKMCNLDVLGWPRTYARLQPGEELTYKTWIEAVRAGRTFVSNGPLLSFTVNEQDPGATLVLSSSESTVRVRAEVRSLAPFDRLQVVANNSVVASAEPSGSPCSAVIDTDVTLQRSGWLVARCWGPWDEAMEGWTGAQSSPVYVKMEGRPLQPDPAAVATLTGYLDRMLNWVNREARCENEQQRARLAGIFCDARAVLEQRSGGRLQT